MLNYKRISILLSAIYALFGYTASIISNGMKGSNGPVIAAIFIFTIFTIDLGVIRRGLRLSHVNVINMASICPFYFFSIALPLFFACPSPISPLIPFFGFSIVTFLPFIVIVYLIRRVHLKIVG